MSDADKLNIIIQQLAEIRQEAREMRKEAQDEAKVLHGRITSLDVNGCSMAVGHRAIALKVEEHEKRINQVTGAIMAAGTMGGLVAWIVNKLGIG